MGSRNGLTNWLAIASIVVIALVFGRLVEAQTVSTWNGANGIWNNAANWSTNPFFPNNGNGAPTYHAILGTGTVNLNTNITLAALTLNGGTLGGASDLTTTDLTLNGGTLSTTGVMNATHMVLTGGVLARNFVLPAGNHTIFNVAIGSGFQLTNPVGSTLTATTGPGEGQSNGPGTFLNQGTFVKSGILRYYLSMPTTNVGLMQVQQSALRLTAAGTHTGTFEALGGATLELSGTQTLMPTASILGPGNLLLIDGNVTINSEVSSGVFRLLNSTLAGNGNLHPGKYLFESGTLARDLTLTTAATHDISSLAISSGFTLTNPSGSTLRALGGTIDGPGSFVNAGALTGATIATFNTFASAPSGVVNVQQGTLALAGVGTHEGTFNVSAGATLTFGGKLTSNNTLTADSLVTGAGVLRAAQGILNVAGDGSNNYTGGTHVDFGARLIVEGSGTGLGTGPVTIHEGFASGGGVLSIAAATNLMPAQALVLDGGALAVRSEFIPQTLIAPASAGTFAIDVNDFATPVDLAVLGNGSMALGSSTVGSYTAATLGVGAGGTYRLGGGGGTLTLTQANVLTGNRLLVVRGLGTVVLQQSQNFTLGTTLAGGTLAIADAAALGPGPIAFQGGGLRAEGGPIVVGNAVTMAGSGTISGQHDVTLVGPTKLTGNRILVVTNTATTEIAGTISEDAAGRRLTKEGPGTLILSAGNSFTGGLSISGGAVVAAVDQNYQGSTSVDHGGVLRLSADLKSTGAITVGAKGGTLSGKGTVFGPTSINGFAAGRGVFSPGDSVGVLGFASGLTLGTFSQFTWDLAALTTTGSGFSWD